MIPAIINVFVKLRDDNITFIDIAMISLATNKTGRSMPLFLTFLHSLPAIMQGQNMYSKRYYWSNVLKLFWSLNHRVVFAR